MKPPTLILTCLFTIIVIWVIFHSVPGIMTSYEIGFWGMKEPDADLINNEFHLDREPSILYLDPGDAPYFFRANSSCRYSTPLPVQRDATDWNLTWMKQYKEEYECIMSYKGMYIVAIGDNMEYWFGWDLPERQPIKEMITRNYSVVSNKSWVIYRRG